MKTPENIPSIIKDIVKKCEIEQKNPSEFLTEEIPYFEKSSFIFKMSERCNLKLFFETISVLQKTGIDLKGIFQKKSKEGFSLLDNFYSQNIMDMDLKEQKSDDTCGMILVLMDFDVHPASINKQRVLKYVFVKTLEKFLDKLTNSSQNPYSFAHPFRIESDVFALGTKITDILSLYEETKEIIEIKSKWNNYIFSERLKANTPQSNENDTLGNADNDDNNNICFQR